jgi:hypothetical protein
MPVFLGGDMASYYFQVLGVMRLNEAGFVSVFPKRSSTMGWNTEIIPPFVHQR